MGSGAAPGAPVATAPAAGAAATTRSKDGSRKVKDRATVSSRVTIWLRYTEQREELRGHITHNTKYVTSKTYSPRAAARVRSSSARSVLHQTNLPPVDVCAVQFVQCPLHV